MGTDLFDLQIRLLLHKKSAERLSWWRATTSEPVWSVCIPATMTKIRLVLFDAFSTLLVPRLPVYVQYSQTFEPYLGTLEPNVIKSSFKSGA